MNCILKEFKLLIRFQKFDDSFFNTVNFMIKWEVKGKNDFSTLAERNPKIAEKTFLNSGENFYLIYVYMKAQIYDVCFRDFNRLIYECYFSYFCMLYST